MMTGSTTKRAGDRASPRSLVQSRVGGILWLVSLGTNLAMYLLSAFSLPVAPLNEGRKIIIWLVHSIVFKV